MALIGNYSVFNKTCGKYLSGQTSLSTNQAQTRANFNRANDWRKFGWQDRAGGTDTIKIYASKPEGNYPPVAWAMASSVGGLSAHNTAVGSNNLTNANLAGGLNGVGPLTGSGDITNANVVWLIIAAAALTGSGDITSDISAVLGGIANLVGAGDIAGAVNAAVGAVANLTGSGDITLANLPGVLSGAANLSGSGDIDAAALAGALLAAAALAGTGSVSATMKAIWSMVGPLTGTGTQSASIIGKGYVDAGLTGTGNATGLNSNTKAFISANITVTGDLLTTANIADAIWGALAEGSLTYKDIQRILMAVAAGKTTISGTTVTFRDQADTKDRITAEMSGSQRSTVDVDPS